MDYQIFVKDSLENEIREAYWNQRSSLQRIPLESKRVTNPQFECEIEITLPKGSVSEQEEMDLTQSIARIGLFREVQKMFFELVESLEDLQWDTFSIDDSRKSKNRHGLHDNTGRDEASRKEVEGDDLFISHSDASSIELQKALDYRGVADAFVKPKRHAENYDLPLIAFEGFKYEINLDRFQETKTNLTYYINYRVIWENVYKVRKISVPDIEFK